MLIEQRSQEWFEMRRGKITSSEIHKIMGGKGESLSETAKTYLLEKACEFYGGHGNPATGAAVEWGMDLEDQAIEVYESKTKNKVDKCSFIPINESYGGSPDGKVKKDGGIEVKCPYNSVNHFKHGLIKTQEDFKKVAPNYYYQCVSHMIALDAKWCDFISYDPRVNEDYQIFVFRLLRDEDEITAVKLRVEVATKYLNELKGLIEQANIPVSKGA